MILLLKDSSFSVKSHIDSAPVLNATLEYPLPNGFIKLITPFYFASPVYGQTRFFNREYDGYVTANIIVGIPLMNYPNCTYITSKKDESNSSIAGIQYQLNP